MNCATAPVITPIEEDTIFQRTVINSSADACQYPVITLNTASDGAKSDDDDTEEEEDFSPSALIVVGKHSNALQSNNIKGHTTKHVTANLKSVQTILRIHSGVSTFIGPTIDSGDNMMLTTSFLCGDESVATDELGDVGLVQDEAEGEVLGVDLSHPQLGLLRVFDELQREVLQEAAHLVGDLAHPGKDGPDRPPVERKKRAALPGGPLHHHTMH